MSLSDYFDRDVTVVARDLLGATLLVDGVGGSIVETEAYHPDDPASHAFGGQTRRNRAMFAGPGHVYVYRSYGLHWCFNLVCADAAAVLLRALEPTAGQAEMAARRHQTEITALCSGPGKLAQALAITNQHDGLRLDAPPFAFRPATTAPNIVVGTRIGITRAAELPWRFGVARSPFVSRKFPG